MTDRESFEGEYKNWQQEVIQSGDDRRFLSDLIPSEDSIWSADKLTGLYKLDAFKHIWDTIEDKQHIAVVIADLNDLKAVNDHHGGHDAGNEYIKRAAFLLRISLRTRDAEHTGRPPDLVFRTHGSGGDEFILLFLDVHSEKEVETIASRLANTCRGGNDENGIVPTLSFGAVYLGENPKTTDLKDVLKRADEVMYQAKRRASREFVRNKLSLLAHGHIKKAIETWQKPSAWEVV